MVNQQGVLSLGLVISNMDSLNTPSRGAMTATLSSGQDMEAGIMPLVPFRLTVSLQAGIPYQDRI